MGEQSGIHLLPNIDVKVEDAFLLNEDTPMLKEGSKFPADAVGNRMVYVTVPIVNDKKLLQECYALVEKIKETKEEKNINLNEFKKKIKKPKITEKHPPPLELDDPMICDICDKVYRNNIAFALHSIQHSSDARYSCHLCLYRNASKYHIEMHIRVHEGTTRYKCEICLKAFTISTHAKEHKYLHSGEKPFQCEICGKKFMFSWFLTSHRRTQHWEMVTGKPLVKYDCLVCSKHYTSSTGLKRHNITHHGAKGVRNMALCDICGKTLSSKEKLKFHTRIHTGYKPHACPECSKCFSKKEQLKEHLRVHTGERPYICKICKKGFTQRSPLRIHERLHSGERPYLCSICDKGFISKSVMDIHKKRCELAKSLYENHCRITLEAQKMQLIAENGKVSDGIELDIKETIKVDAKIDVETKKDDLTDQIIDLNLNGIKPTENTIKLDLEEKLKFDTKKLQDLETITLDLYAQEVEQQINSLKPDIIGTLNLEMEEIEEINLVHKSELTDAKKIKAGNTDFKIESSTTDTSVLKATPTTYEEACDHLELQIF